MMQEKIQKSILAGRQQEERYQREDDQYRDEAARLQAKLKRYRNSCKEMRRILSEQDVPNYEPT